MCHLIHECPNASEAEFRMYVSVEQLIKCTKNNCRLEIKLEGRKKEVFAFSNVRKREHFCQVVQQLKNIHSPSEELQQISVFVGTWNMGKSSVKVKII